MAKRDCASEVSTEDSALQPAHSRRRISRISEPDLTVVVGGETFLHHSVIFCLASEYFDKMLSSDTRESHTMRIEFPDGDPEEWVRFCRYLEPRSLFTASTFPVNEEDAKTLFPWFHLFGMTNLLQECDERLSISSPKFLDDDDEEDDDDDSNDVDHQRSTMTDILVWVDTATTYSLSKTLDALMKELNKAVNTFPEIITAEILDNMRPLWSTAAGTELWEAVKAILPDDVKLSHNENNDNHGALKASKLLFELCVESCKVPAQIRTLYSEADFNAIVNLMKKYRSCPWIQEQGCVAFQDPDDNNISIAVKDVIEVIVSAMAAHSNVSKVQELGCGALWNLARNDANSVSIATNHGIEAIMSAMAANSDVSKVQEWGCLALGTLARNDANSVSIAAKYGIEAILSAMTAHINESMVQEEGCLALSNLACGNHANCVSIAAKHGIEAIVSAMTAHSNDSTVQEVGCDALGTLACDDATCVSIAAKHGIEAIVSAMTAHSNVSKVQERGCLALGILARNIDANRVSIAAKQGIEAIVSAMTTHSNIPEMQERGCVSLLSLTLNESVAVRVELGGGVDVLEQNPNNSNAEVALQRINEAFQSRSFEFR
jgi:hypothetical protein